MEKSNLAALAMAGILAAQSTEAKAVDAPDTLSLEVPIIQTTTDTNWDEIRLQYGVRVDRILGFLDEPKMEFGVSTMAHTTAAALQADFQQGLLLEGDALSLTAGGEIGIFGLISSETQALEPLPVQLAPYVAANAYLYTNGAPLEFGISGRLEHFLSRNELRVGDGTDYQTSLVPSVGASLLVPLGDDANTDSNLGPTLRWFPTDHGEQPALELSAAITAKF